MAYSTVANVVAPPDVITIAQEKEFVRTQLFIGDEDNFRQANVFINIFDDIGDPTAIPLTSVIYTPNRRFFESSKLFYSIGGNSNKLLPWLKKHNILVIIYGETSLLDNSLQAPRAFSDTMLLRDVIETSGCTSSIYTSCLQSSSSAVTTNEDFIQLLRLEASPDEFRLQAINDRINNVYSFNFSPINYLVFNDLNNDKSISKFLKNTMNISFIS